MIFAIDPGTTKSAWLRMVTNYDGDGRKPYDVDSFGIDVNDDVLAIAATHYSETLAIEMVASFGMPVGAEVFETVRWIGRFEQHFRDRWCSSPVALIYRKDVKLSLCGTTRAKDPHVRQALIDRYGGVSATKKGGRLHGISKDVWSALAVACVTLDRMRAPVDGRNVEQ